MFGVSTGRTALVIAISGALAVQAAVVDAQTEETTEGGKPRGATAIMLEEVLVSAQKRSTAEDVLRVPISVTALSGDMMEAMNVEKLADLSATIPNVDFAPNSFTPNVPDMNIRGQGTQSSIPSDDPAVGVFVDGVVLGMLNGANLEMFDIETAEVLRGPQGTLFGRNVTAGALLLRTKRPSFDPSADVQLTVGSGGQADAMVSATGPLYGEVLAGKVAVLYNSTDGYFKNVNTTPPRSPVLGENVSLNKDLGESESVYVRPSLRWVPAEAMIIDLIAEYGEIDGDNGLGVKGIQNVAGNVTLPDFDNNEEVSHTNNGINKVRTESVTVDGTYETQSGQWAWISGYRSTDAYNLVEVDGGGIDIFQVALDPENEQYSQEIRWSGRPFDMESIEATLGGFYFTQDVSYREGRWITADLRPQPILQGLGGDIEHSSWAAFGSMTWDISESWYLNAGLRYTDEEKSTNQSNGANCNPLDFGTCDFGIQDETSWQNVSGNTSVQYFSSEDVQWYLSYARGFRSGGFNLRNANAGVDPGYDEETVDSYELGMKNNISDELRVSVAVFRAIYDDLQRTVLLSDGSQTIGNSGKSTVDGAELELSWVVVDNLLVDFSYGYLDGAYDNLEVEALNGFNAIRASSGFGPLSTSQFDLARSPDTTASLNVTLDQPLNNGAIVSYLVGSTYRGSYATNDANTLYAPSYYDLSASITFQPSSDKWSVSVWGKNLTDETIVVAGSDISLFDVLSILPGPRYGVNMTYHF